MAKIRFWLHHIQFTTTIAFTTRVSTTTTIVATANRAILQWYISRTQHIERTMVCRRMFFQGKQIVTLKLKRTLVSLSLSQHQSSVQCTQCPKHVQKPYRLQFSRCTLWQCHTGSSAWRKQSSQDSNAGPLSPNTNSHSTSVIPRVPCYCFFSVSINKITGLKESAAQNIKDKWI